ncbi:TatD family hydrolase [Basilea psittacipulmonis]|uniref:DNAase n=1 Tax=Basilea psittacipulmonis DSM 24701 TaxID=1072685 RepID=A0A077DEW1_9BURK|nr:TatD family hydrolase [Basilea psittacipulmonis]AIL32686.1 hypothetical protein IX83_04625 [Basilea psittacipulmonis DSM 24701]
MKLIDTHCHLDFISFEKEIEHVLEQSAQAGVGAIIIPTVSMSKYETALALSARYKQLYFCLGIHPLFMHETQEKDIETLESLIKEQLDNPKFLGLGEIGLDFYYPDNEEEKQIQIFKAQLSLAKKYQLPVMLHTRKSADQVIKYLRQYQITRGIAHAFNGSMQQAESYIKQGLKLGFGGACTWSRAKNIRRLLCEVDLSSIVLETDAPDIPPYWLDKDEMNLPHELGRIAEEIAQIKGVPLDTLIQSSTKNTLEIFQKDIVF